MKILGYELTLRKAVTKALTTVDSDRGWLRIFDSTPGRWQQHTATDADSTENLLLHGAAFACTTLIAGDVAKLRPTVLHQRPGYWAPVSEDAHAVLRRPNHFQTRNQFFESWVLSKLIHGNAYVLKGREPRSGFINGLYVLDPTRVDAALADDGSVFYQLRADKLAGLRGEQVMIPQSEVIHDRWNTFHHPLIGNSPLRAAAWAATTGNRIAKNSSNFFGNMSRPSGILVAPGAISTDTATALKEYWQSNFTGDNIGKISVLGDGLKYEALSMSADDAQLIEQLNWTAADVARAFKIPLHMIGAGPVPAGVTNVESLTQQYFSQTLQTIIEALESCLDDGLELGNDLRIEFDLDGLLRMDSATRFKAYADAVGGGWMSPNEARRKENLPPTPGGDSCYLQMQNFSLLALSKRDAKEDPFSTTGGGVEQ